MNKTSTKVTGKLKLVTCILVTIDYIKIVTDDLFLLSFLCNDKNTFIRQGWANNFWTLCKSRRRFIAGIVVPEPGLGYLFSVYVGSPYHLHQFF